MGKSRALTSIALAVVTLSLLLLSPGVTSSYSTPQAPTCPDFKVCLSVLNLPLLLLGVPPPSSCCGLISPLADLDASVCLCSALKVDLLGIAKVDIPLTLQLFVNKCGKDVPRGFQCIQEPLTPPPPPPKVYSPPPPPKVYSPPPPPPKVYSPPPPKVYSPPPPPPKVYSPPPPPPKVYSPPPPPPYAPPPHTCQLLNACVKVLSLPEIILGHHPPPPCCGLIQGLADVDARVCLCAAIKVRAAGLVNLNVPLAIDLWVNNCTGKNAHPTFKCY